MPKKEEISQKTTPTKPKLDLHFKELDNEEQNPKLEEGWI